MSIVTVAETFVGVVGLVFLGLFLLFIFSVLVGHSERATIAEQYESQMSTNQIARRDQRIELLEQIRGIPKCRDGSLHPHAQKLWSQYRVLEAENNQLTRAEHNHLVELQGYLPDEIADIIEGYDV